MRIFFYAEQATVLRPIAWLFALAVKTRAQGVVILFARIFLCLLVLFAAAYNKLLDATRTGA